MAQKPESRWRTKLIQQFKKNHPGGFIWAHDPKFRHGFPDLEFILPPEGRVIHAELKVIGGSCKDPFAKVDPRQWIVLEDIVDSGGCAYVFTLDPKKDIIHGFDVRTKTIWQTTRRNFEENFFSELCLLSTRV